MDFDWGLKSLNELGDDIGTNDQLIYMKYENLWIKNYQETINLTINKLFYFSNHFWFYFLLLSIA